MPETSFTCAICKRECDEKVIFETLNIWRDPVARSGPENMAVDEWLLREVREVPVLRLYEWSGDWVSLGYFQSLSAAREVFGGGVNYVRRWTGGGIVDHRSDATYSLIIPRSEPMAGGRGGDSYCAIHRAVAACLEGAGTTCELAAEDSLAESVACFEKPVQWDLLGGDGRKLAGAGQRRGRKGILHQGSVAASRESLAGLGEELARSCREMDSPGFDDLEELIGRYSRADWLARVP